MNWIGAESLVLFPSLVQSQTVVYEAGVQAHPYKFRFVENPGEISEILGKIPENLGKNGA